MRLPEVGVGAEMIDGDEGSGRGEGPARSSQQRGWCEMSNVLVYAEHLNGEITEATFELLALARSLAGSTGGSVETAIIGSGASLLGDQLGGADTILVGDTEALGAFNPQGHAAVFTDLIGSRSPAIVLVPYTSVGMDVASVAAAGH